MNSKKCTSFLIAILLLVSNIGFAFNVHYCGGKIASISLDSSLTRSCCAKTDKKMTCCKDKLFHVEKKSDNATVKIFFFQFAIQANVQEIIVVNPFRVLVTNQPQLLTYYVEANAPPLFRLHQQLLFYA